MKKGYYDYARMAVSGIAAHYSDRDDLLQEAAIAVFLKSGKVDTTRSESEQNAYLCRIARSGAYDHTRKLAKHRKFEFSMAEKESANLRAFDGEKTRDHLPSSHGTIMRYMVDLNTPEQAVLANELRPRVYKVLAIGYSRLSDQEKALMRFRFGYEPARADLVRLGKGCGKVSNFARKKIMAVAREHGVEEITHRLLLAAFGTDPTRETKPDVDFADIRARTEIQQ